MATPAAADRPSCSCSNIAIMQLFHELKQRFPAVPDRVVSECIRKNFHDRPSCELILGRENQAYLLHSYPASLKMCAAASEPTSPLASNFHGLNFCDKFSTRPRLDPNSECASTSTPSSPQFARTRNVQWPHLNTWFDDAVSGLQVHEARNPHVRAEPQQAVFCRDRFPYLDQLRRYFPSSVDQDLPVDPFLFRHRVMHEEGDSGARWGELAGSTVQNSNRWSEDCVHSPVGHYHSQQGDARVPYVPVSNSGNTIGTSTVYQRQSLRPSSLDVRSHGMDEKRSVPIRPGISDPFSSVMPGGDFHKCELQQSSCDSQFGGPQGSYNEGVCVDDFHMNVNCSLQQSPIGSSVNIISNTEPKQRMRSTIELQPLPHYSSLDYRARGKGQEGSSPRSYTSVNLMLRPPSSEPQPPIDIQSAGSSLTYSTSSYDPRQGYQSQLQIRIGPGASGSVTAVRKRAREPVPPSPAPSPPRSAYSLARSGSLPDVNTMLSMISESSEDSLSSQEEASLAAQIAALGCDKLDSQTRELLAQQMERKTRLQRELRKEKDKLRKMQKEVQSMKKDLAQRELLKRRSTNLSLPVVTTVLQKVQQLRQDIQWLQEECKHMTHEVDDLNTDTTVPLGETDEEFYKNIYTGQQGRILPPQTATSFLPRRRVAGEQVHHWTCSACTYKNHPLLDKCEQCDMPHIELADGETQDIHIHVTHHNFPARRDMT